MKDQWIDWLQDKQRHFFYGIIITLASLFIAFQAFGKFHKPATSNYLFVNQAFEKWMYQDEAFEKLETALHQNPELETKFGALIADKFLVQKSPDQAQPFADNVFQRVLNQTPEHTAFAQNSLLIEKGKLPEALTSSLALKTNLDPNTLLYGFNLVRIASLSRALDSSPQEQSALTELETYLHTNAKATTILTECFHEGNLTLTDYITHRKTSAPEK
ncbi:MAG: hypothetical protein P0S96_02785 [Simkaniaceae bacterium]|nr:hypothetical protein [Candidatus Sacchlamyda saccharinae]